jgi:preprotein translocase subunit SecG
MSKDRGLLKFLGGVAVGVAVDKVAKIAKGAERETVDIAPPMNPKTITDEQLEALQKLKKLLDTGVLSQGEFDAKKREILKINTFAGFGDFFGHHDDSENAPKGGHLKDWYCYIDNQQCGPYPEKILRQLVQNDRISNDTLVYNGDTENAHKGWQKAIDTEISLLLLDSGGVEDMNDVKTTIMSKIRQAIKESDNGTFIMGLLFLGSFGLLLLGAMFEWMGKHKVLAGALIVLVILFMATAMILRHRRLKRQQDIEILNADVSKMGDDEATRRAKKYQS